MRPDRPGAYPMKARVIVTLKSSVLDPQGKAIEGALKGLAVDGLSSVRQGKVFDIELDGDDHATARRKLSEACERLLANTIVENYAIEIAYAPCERRSSCFLELIAKATSRARFARPRAPSRRSSGTPNTNCRRASIWSSCRVDSPTAIICAAARSRRERRSCGRSAITRRAADWCLASAMASRSCARPAFCPAF